MKILSIWMFNVSLQQPKLLIMIKEELLHYLWRTHRLPKIGLKTSEGESVEILQTGILNAGNGPDFMNAKVRIGDTLWHGPVEMHLKSSDWYAHKHQLDERYNSVVLHVVLEEDKPVEINGCRIPCIEVGLFLEPKLIDRYKKLMASKHEIACAPYEIPEINTSFMWMRDKLILERLQRKLESMYSPGKSQIQVFYELLFGALGSKANKIPFMTLAQKISWSQVSRWKTRPERVFAYILLLSGLPHDLAISLSEKKLIEAYIDNQKLSERDWQTKGIRPPSQPKKRLLEICLCLTHDIFTQLFETNSAYAFNEVWLDIQKNLESGTHNHLRFSPFVLQNIAINTIAPFAFYRGIQTSDPEWFDFALFQLDEWHAEKNNVVSIYKAKYMKIRSSGDSQALLELYQEYCISKKCVTCAIGNTLLST